MKVFENILTAKFHQYSDGKKVIKIKYTTGWEEERENTEWSFNRSHNLEALKLMWNSFKFEHGSFIVDNRTESDYIQDYENAMISRVRYEIKTETYESWKASQKLIF